MAPSDKPKRLLSISRAFTQLLIIGVTLPALLIWVIGHWPSNAAVSDLWEHLSHELSGHAVESTLRFIETGEH